MFAGYCHHGTRWVSHPEVGYELLQVNVVHRHGARALWAPLECWAAAPGQKPQTPSFRCAELPFAIASGLERHQLLKRYDLPGGCGVGSLLPEADEQFANLARSLNESYSGTPWWSTLNMADPENVYLYSDDNERNLGSIDMLVAYLSPRAAAESEIFVNTLPSQDDPFDVGAHYVQQSLCDGSDLEALQQLRVDTSFKRFAAAWRNAANVSWHHTLFDCVLTARCSGAGLPAALGGSLADEALFWGPAEQLAAVRSTNWTSVLASRALDALGAVLQKGADENSVRLSLWSTHDTTMMYLLQALLAWDGTWPGYASSIAFELYKHKDAHFVKVVRDGKSISIGACGGKTMCPLQDFLVIAKRYQDELAACIRLSQQSTKAQLLSTLGGVEESRLRPTALIIFALGFLACVAWIQPRLCRHQDALAFRLLN
eukprot:TRINITY_DN97250_c0_g1_i1.p1 TRINITY_DN97250_c0_g1~~TRINITY_DN97250_c0_g1_i1.p1  ORF type:complete len:479 (+),score=65.80 TRINITY_DN97250_c0_g1_i1:149-1438(+)